MISKQKRNVILAYCMASVIVLSAFASTVTQFASELRTSTKKIVTEGNTYLETNNEEVSYGLVAIEASSSIQNEEKTEDVTEEKKEDKSSNDDKDKKSESKKETTKSTTKNSTTKKKSTKKTAKSSTKKSTSKTTSKPVAKGNTELGQQIVSYAKQFVGNPYKMGGTSLTNGADCSGFTQSVFKHFGIKLPRSAASQTSVGRSVPLNQLQAGDLVFYSKGGQISHVAIYIGNGKIVHAGTPKSGINISTVNIMTKVTARRLV